MKVLLETTGSQRAGRDRGIGRYIDAVVAANEALGNELAGVTVRTGTHRASELVALLRRSIQLRAETFDVFHAPTPYYQAVGRWRRPSVTSILDLIPLEVRSHRRTGIKAEIVHRLAAASDHVLTLSEFTAERITAILGIPPDRITVAPLPIAQAFTDDGPAADSPTGGPYVAMLMDLRSPDPRKRHHWFPAIADHLAHLGFGLVVAGAGSDRLASEAVIGLGRVDDLAWARILRGARLFVYPSAYEGQGMPPLEAIACGVPVVAMANSALPETVGRAGWLVPEPGDSTPRDLLSGVSQILLTPDLRSALAAECSAQAARFDAATFAAKLMGAYEAARR